MAFNPTMAGAVGGVGGMVKALMEGNDQNKQQQMMQQMMAARGQPSLANINMMRQGAPAPQPAGPMQGGMAPGMQPFPQSGAPPMNIDPMTKALFSPIPGMNPQGG